MLIAVDFLPKNRSLMCHRRQSGSRIRFSAIVSHVATVPASDVIDVTSREIRSLAQ